jgi:hypothetical protein
MPAFPIAERATAVAELRSLIRLFDRAVNVLNRAMTGKLNAINSDGFPLTLTANVASTVLTDSRLGTNSFIAFDPVTANAAAELAAGTMYVPTANRRDGNFTVTHANNAQTDRIFRYLIIG